jgi:hypothetical protein
MALSNVVRRLTAAELAREPRSLALIAYFDGWGQATGLPPRDYPRVITAAEARHWREGWAEGKAAAAQVAS